MSRSHRRSRKANRSASKGLGINNRYFVLLHYCSMKSPCINRYSSADASAPKAFSIRSKSMDDVARFITSWRNLFGFLTEKEGERGRRVSPWRGDFATRCAWPIVRRIVRNKAAEKAKHAHQQQQAQQQQGQQQGQPGSGGSVSVIAHAPATAAGHPAATAPNAYSISGILGIPAHHQDPNGNSIKRKRSVDGESLASLLARVVDPGFFCVRISFFVCSVIVQHYLIPSTFIIGNEIVLKMSNCNWTCRNLRQHGTKVLHGGMKCY